MSDRREPGEPPVDKSLVHVMETVNDGDKRYNFLILPCSSSPSLYSSLLCLWGYLSSLFSYLMTANEPQRSKREGWKEMAFLPITSPANISHPTLKMEKAGMIG